MFDFSKQVALLELAKSILDIQYQGSWSFGGGTALSMCYWRHRFSEDVDIFLHEPSFALEFLTPNIRNKRLKDSIYKRLQALGFQGFYYHDNMFEYEFEDSTRIQFIKSPFITYATPAISKCIDKKEYLVESPYEILGKKIAYRYNKVVSRDIYDLVIGIRHFDIELKHYLESDALGLDVFAQYANILHRLLDSKVEGEKFRAEMELLDISYLAEESFIKTLYEEIREAIYSFSQVDETKL